MLGYGYGYGYGYGFALGRFYKVWRTMTLSQHPLVKPPHPLLDSIGSNLKPRLQVSLSVLTPHPSLMLSQSIGSMGCSRIRENLLVLESV